MSTPNFSRPGAVDLSALRPSGAVSGQSAAVTATGRFTLAIESEQALRSEVVERSLSVVVLVSFWSPQAPASQELNSALSQLADEFAGKFLLATVDVDSQPELAQALGIPQVPLVVAAIRGQLAPLLQQPLPVEELRAVVDQVLQAAAANGVTGTAEPVGAAGPVDEQEPTEAPSKYPEAEAALMSGDLDGAIAMYEKALRENPGDAEAAVELARAKLLQRTQDVDLTTARAAAADRPADVDAQLMVADLDLLGGHVEDAFTRVIEVVRRGTGDERERARTHLIELFAVVGDADARVGKARQTLASVLF
jgi:putative thioredoxin